jgi:hypothetical protein
VYERLGEFGFTVDGEESDVSEEECCHLDEFRNGLAFA